MHLFTLSKSSSKQRLLHKGIVGHHGLLEVANAHKPFWGEQGASPLEVCLVEEEKPDESINLAKELRDMLTISLCKAGKTWSAGLIPAHSLCSGPLHRTFLSHSPSLHQHWMCRTPRWEIPTSRVFCGNWYSIQSSKLCGKTYNSTNRMHEGASNEWTNRARNILLAYPACRLSSL